MRLLLVRHGQTSWNQARRAQGHTDTELDALGLAQSERLVSVFSGSRVGVVLSSDLRRCVQTAERVAQGSSASLETTPVLRERGFGLLEGQDFDLVRATIAIEAEKSGREVFDVRPDGGESFSDVWSRLDQLVVRLRDMSGEAAIVSHGGTIGLLIARLIEAGPAAARNIRVNNCSVSELHRRADGGWSLVRVNDCRHLEGLSEGVVLGA